MKAIKPLAMINVLKYIPLGESEDTIPEDLVARTGKDSQEVFKSGASAGWENNSRRSFCF
jgi:hypothetical protein